MQTSDAVVLDFFGQLYRYREFLKQSVLRDLRNKYKRALLGYLWTMLHPLGMMAVLAIVFSHIMAVPTKDYAVFVFCGLLPWTFFNSTALMALHSIKSNARLFGQIAVPKYLFILSLTFSNLVNLLFALVPLVLIMLAVGRDVPPAVIALPLILLPLVLITIGISLLLAVSNVFFDDTLHLAEVVLQAVYFLCPILYSRERLPAELVQVLAMNPLFGQIEFLRDLFYSGTLPDPSVYLLNLLGSFVIFACCLWVFRRAEDKFLYFV